MFALSGFYRIHSDHVCIVITTVLITQKVCGRLTKSFLPDECINPGRQDWGSGPGPFLVLSREQSIQIMLN
jgi:hypothetical protein